MMRLFTFFAHNLFLSLAGILGIGFLIGFHELGHFLFCKLFNIRTPSFSIGFGPRIISKKIGETEFSLSAIPLGGYVEIAGSAEVGQGDQKDASATDERSFARKPYWQKMLVMFGGIFFNLIFAYFALTLLFFAGLPKTEILYPLNATPVIEAVKQDSPAEKAGLSQGDTLLRLNGNSIASVEEFLTTITKSPDESINLTYVRNGTENTVTVPLDHITTEGKTPVKTGFLGAKFVIQAVPGYSLIESIKHGFSLTNRFIKGIFNAFLGMFKQKNINAMAGPLAVISQTVSGAGQGFWIFLLFLSIISINLAVLNIIPLPILDGGQILFHTIEAIVGRSIPAKVREYIAIGTWILILTLTIYLTYKDLSRMTKPYYERLKERFQK